MSSADAVKLDALPNDLREKLAAEASAAGLSVGDYLGTLAGDITMLRLHARLVGRAFRASLRRRTTTR